MADEQRSPYTGYTFTVPPYVVPPIMHPGMYVEDQQMKAMQMMTHNCIQKSLLSGAMGFVMGGAMGMFMASMRYDTPFHTPTPTPEPAVPAATAKTPTSTATAQTTSATTSAVTKTTPAAPSSSISSAVRATLPQSASASVSSAAATATATATAAVESPTTWHQVKHGFKDMGRSSYSMAKNFSKVGAVFAGVECGIEGLRGKNDFVNPVAAGCLTGGILAMNAGPQAAVGGCVAFAAFSAAIEAWLRSDSASD